MKIRADDPTAMKTFILHVQDTSNKLKASSGDVPEKNNSKRVRMLCACFVMHLKIQTIVLGNSLSLVAFANHGLRILNAKLNTMFYHQKTASSFSAHSSTLIT
jgi:hypothetical protein